MKALLLSLALVGFVASLDLEPLLNMCSNPPSEQKKLSDKMTLPASYKISGSVTDWKGLNTYLLMETSTNGFRVLERKKDEQVDKWIQYLSGDKRIEYITKDGDCDEKAAKPEIIKVPRFASIIGNETSSISSIVNGILVFIESNSGYAVKDHVDLVGGVNAMKWVSCVNGTSANDTKVLVEIRYGGDDSIAPAVKGFSNPILLSIRLAELSDFNSTVPINHWSLELDRFELPSGNEANIAHGIYCQGRNETAITLKPLDEFAANLNFFDYETNKSEVVEVLYSKSNKVFIVAGSSFDNVMRQKVNYDGNLKYANETDFILHDFQFGYEFTMSRGACDNFTGLTDNTNDVIVDNNTVLLMKPMENILVEDRLRWVLYENDVDMTGNSLRTYRASDGLDHVVELHLTQDGEVHSINKFRARKIIQSMTVTRIPIASSGLNTGSVQIADCYDNVQYSNNTWILPIKDKNITDLHKVGLPRFNKAVVETINKNVAPVIPYRVVAFYVENRDGGLSMLLRLSEKTTIQPGNVGYNYTTELNTAELFNKMNASLFSEKMPIVVETITGAKEEWIADASAMKSFPPDTDTGFLGYTGGAMFVLAIFCLLIGVSIGAVGVFVVTRRQRISTLAYQVFE
ncbi:hypothetical protein CRE_03681 [Caenorhabditis remanei]|uniref:Uncharacterized protein n=1 Tax=Caenorhabditis remanei TaxID=31234 RepID=E3LXN2_CAERE|nr:hypothetical protein CRE_03681 [Caenorhabditis remanei]